MSQMWLPSHETYLVPYILWTKLCIKVSVHNMENAIWKGMRMMAESSILNVVGQQGFLVVPGYWTIHFFHPKIQECLLTNTKVYTHVTSSFVTQTTIMYLQYHIHDLQRNTLYSVPMVCLLHAYVQYCAKKDSLFFFTAR